MALFKDCLTFLRGYDGSQRAFSLVTFDSGIPYEFFFDSIVLSLNGVAGSTVLPSIVEK